MFPIIPFWMFPPLWPGVFEPLLFLILVKVFVPSRPKLQIFGWICLLTGAVWTLYAGFTLRAVPFVLAAAYALPALLAFALARRAQTMRALIFATVLLDLLLIVGAVFGAHVPLARSVTVLCTSCSEPPLRAVNGYQLRLQVNGDPREFTFTNQGFAQAKEQANINHQEVLDLLAANPGKTFAATMTIDYFYGVPWEPHLVAIGGLDFLNFYYLPDLLHDRTALLDLLKKEAAP